jgi:hypothetical protein
LHELNFCVTSVRTFSKPQNKQSSAFFEFSKTPLLYKEGLGGLENNKNTRK